MVRNSARESFKAGSRLGLVLIRCVTNQARQYPAVGGRGRLPYDATTRPVTLHDTRLDEAKRTSSSRRRVPSSGIRAT